MLLFILTVVGGLGMVAAAAWVMLRPFEDEPEAGERELRERPSQKQEMSEAS